MTAIHLPPVMTAGTVPAGGMTGQMLVKSSNADYATTWKMGPFVWQYDAGGAAWSNDSTAHTLFAATQNVPAMAVGDMLNIRSGFWWLNNSGATQGYAGIVRWAGTTIANIAAAAVAAAAQAHHVALDISCVCKTVGGAGVGQLLVMGYAMPTSATPNVSLDTVQGVSSLYVGSGVLTVPTDGSSATALDIQVNMTTATATSTITPLGTHITYWMR